MHSSNMIFAGVVLLSGLVAVMGTDPITLTLGSTAYVATASQATGVVLGLIGLAAIKKAAFVAIAARRRGRRHTNDVSQVPLNFEPFFDEIARTDIADCGKLLVCHVMAKAEGALSPKEKIISELFEDFDVVNAGSGHGEYQLAAYAGTFKKTELCTARYSRCPFSPLELLEIAKA